MRIALRAQAQCRATLETLAMIKNPPVVYARQANIANGPQHVKNGGLSRSPVNEIQQTKLSGESNELRPDAESQSLANRANQEVDALGEVDRAKIGTM
jgi:hypothetical protein